MKPLPTDGNLWMNWDAYLSLPPLPPTSPALNGKWMQLEQDSIVATVLREYFKPIPKSGNPLEVASL